MTLASLATVARRSRRPPERAANRLAEELRGVLITINSIRARLPKAALYVALKDLRLGIISDEHVANDDLRTLLRHTRRAERLRDDIREFRTTSRERQEARAEQALAKLGRT